GRASAGLLATPEGSAPLWLPIPIDIQDLLGRASSLVPVADGAFGASLLFVDEAGDDPQPSFSRDGIPLGTGHRWADDPWAVSLSGVELTGIASGPDRWGASAPAIALTSTAPATDAATTDTRFTKGSDDSYLRRVSFRTPVAPWSLRFDFDELIDQLPEDDLVGAANRHESKFRSARASVSRRMSDGTRLELTHERIRKHKTVLPVHDALHQELWAQRTSLAWRGETPVGRLQAAVFVNGADVEWDRARKLEIAREGVQVELAGRDDGLELGARVMAWRLDDDGTGTAEWAGDDAGPVSSGGQEAAMTALRPLRVGGLRVVPTGILRWHRQAGWNHSASLDLQAADSDRMRLTLQHGGRSPRSDELYTAARVTGAGIEAVLLPQHELGWESLDRAALSWRAGLLGNELVIDGAVRRLRDGIGWRPLAGETVTGRWANEVELDGWNVDLKLRRAGRCAGWARVEGIVSARGHDVKAGTPIALPPERSAVLNVFWEKHWFHEDGILELGYILEHRGGMGDPWLPGDDVRLPSVTLHHVIVGFRLVGVDLGYELHNLTNRRVPVSAGSLSPGQVNRWRMHWTFRH
ncbi:TonB-dependent receptor, partial [bacterium]|nr:TonB-dependent receptor [bacterium]